MGARQPRRPCRGSRRGDGGAGARGEPRQRVLEGRRQAVVLRADRSRPVARVRLRLRGDGDDGAHTRRARSDGGVRREAEAALLLSDGADARGWSGCRA